MQIVIDILEEDWNDIKNGYIPWSIGECLKKGTPLLQGHGRLIDADKFKHNLKWNENIDNAPTVLEADKEVE